MFDDKLKGVLDFAFDTRTEPKPVEPAATPQAHPAVLARSGNVTVVDFGRKPK